MEDSMKLYDMGATVLVCVIVAIFTTSILTKALKDEPLVSEVNRTSPLENPRWEPRRSSVDRLLSLESQDQPSGLGSP